MILNFTLAARLVLKQTSARLTPYFKFVTKLTQYCKSTIHFLGNVTELYPRAFWWSFGGFVAAYLVWLCVNKIREQFYISYSTICPFLVQYV